MHKYKTSVRKHSISPNIEKVKIERETTSSIYINGVRAAKSSQFDQYWDTWVEARNYILHQAQIQEEHLKDRLTETQDTVDVISRLNEPE